MAAVKAKGKRIAMGTGAIALVFVVMTGYLGRDRIRFWLLFAPLGSNAQGYSEYRHRQSGIVLVRLPGGTFSMGAQKENPDGPNYDPEALDNEAPVHEVTLSPFLIAKTEVTQAQWKRGMGSNPSGFTGDEVRPVELVSWEDIQEFEALTGLALPTEAEWEYACRAGTTTPYAGKPEDLGWFDENSGRSTHPVGTKAPNGFGLHDVHGNVWEWVEDIYNGGFYGKPEASGPDPVSSAGSGDRVVRGGSWEDGAWNCRSSFRRGNHPRYQVDVLGLRPAWRWAR